MSDIIQTVATTAHKAAKRIADHIEYTAMPRSTFFSDLLGANVYLKKENLQTTGSFKLRGATNRLLTLSQEQRERGCVAASSGNHGAAVACAMQKLAMNGVIFVPQQTSAAKVEKIRSYGGDVQFFGSDGLDTEQHARAYADEHGMVYLSPYNDDAVIAGQGTCGVEIIEQLADVDSVYIAVGGGGLISGVGCVLKAQRPDVRIIGCQPAASAVMAHSIDAGEILDLPSEATLSDGTAGGIEAGAVTFRVNQTVVDEFVLVDEDAIVDALRQYQAAEGEIVEGAAGVAIAALLKHASVGENIVVIVCGGNASQETLERI